MVRLTDRPDMTLDVYRGRKITIQQQPPTSDAFLTVLYSAYQPNMMTQSGYYIKGTGSERERERERERES